MSGKDVPPPEQQKAIEIEHDHQEHFSFYHEYMIPIWTAAISAIGLIVVAWITSRNRKPS